MSIITAANVKDIWAKSKPRQALFEHLQAHFKPKSSLDKERVDYNALLILAEFQTYNLELCKNELCLSDEQSSAVLHLFWQLLEFDPDAQPEAAVTQSVQFHDEESEADRNFQALLRRKITLLQQLIEGLLDSGIGISGEQAKRMIQYSQRTFFRHLRLYDFVLRNASLNEKKYVRVTLKAPQMGQSLDDAVSLDAAAIQYEDIPVDEPVLESHRTAEKPESVESTLQQPSGTAAVPEESETTKIVNKTVTHWGNKFTATLDRDLPQPPAGLQGQSTMKPK